MNVCSLFDETASPCGLKCLDLAIRLCWLFFYQDHQNPAFGQKHHSPKFSSPADPRRAEMPNAGDDDDDDDVAGDDSSGSLFFCKHICVYTG